MPTWFGGSQRATPSALRSHTLSPTLLCLRENTHLDAALIRLIHVGNAARAHAQHRTAARRAQDAQGNERADGAHCRGGACADALPIGVSGRRRRSRGGEGDARRWSLPWPQEGVSGERTGEAGRAGRTYEKKQPLRPTISLSGLHSNGKLPARKAYQPPHRPSAVSPRPSLLPNAP